MKDTTDILHKLDAISSALDNANLVSLDLKSLYIRIPNAEGVKAVKESGDKKKKKKCDNKSIDNIFGSYSKLKQLCAQLLALSSNKGLCHGYDMCIILCKYFHGSLCEEIYIYPFLQGLSLFYLRFIDDIFFKWTGAKEQLTSFLNNLKKTQFRQV